MKAHDYMICMIDRQKMTSCSRQSMSSLAGRRERLS